MLELGKGDVVEKLNKELTGDILLVGGESFNGNENDRGSDDEGVKGVNARCGEEMDLDGLKVRWGQVGRFISGRCWEVWHLYGGGLECR